MRIDSPLCNFKNCRYFFDHNCTAKKVIWERCEYRQHSKTGEAFNDLVSSYPISAEELLPIVDTVCKFITQTQITNIDNYLFVDAEKTMPRMF